MRRLHVSLLATAALALAALAAPAASSAANCPPGQEGTPPYCKVTPTQPSTPTPTPPPPEEPLSAVTVANEVASGAVKVTLYVPGAGPVTLKGNAIKNLRIRVNSAGNIFIKLRPTGRVLQHLQNRGWTRRKQIRVTFTGADGSTQTVKLVVRFRKAH